MISPSPSRDVLISVEYNIEIAYHRAGPKLKKSETRVFWGLGDDEHVGVAVVGLGKQNLGINQLEEIHEGKENVREAAAGKLQKSYNFLP